MLQDPIRSLPKIGCGESFGRSFSGAFKKFFLEGLNRSADQARVMSRMRNPREWGRFVLSVCPFVLFVCVCHFGLIYRFSFVRERVQGLEGEGGFL